MDPIPEYKILHLILLRRLQRRQRQRSSWFRPILLRREQSGEYHTLVREMRASDAAADHRYLQMSAEGLDETLACTLTLV